MSGPLKLDNMEREPQGEPMTSADTIGFRIPHLRIDGAEQVALNPAEALCNEGMKVDVVVPETGQGFSLPTSEGIRQMDLGTGSVVRVNQYHPLTAKGLTWCSHEGHVSAAIGSGGPFREANHHLSGKEGIGQDFVTMA